MSMPSLLKLSEYRPDQPFTVLIPPYTVLLKDGETTATIYPIHSADQLPPGLLAFLADEFNMEVERGDTFPFFETLDIEEFKQFWFSSFAAVMVLGEDEQLDHQRQWEKECLGTFFIRANFPGRSSHISTGGFLVNAGIRGKGIGRTLVECFLDWAPKLGYTSSMFNLVFESNVGARKIFESLNFKRIGKIKAAGILKEHENAVDAYIYGKELVQTVEPSHATYRFDKIKYYLETGRYPPLIDRQEKSRLRSSAAHYRLVDGKLMLNGREVIGDPVRQLEICTDYHRHSHGGINKTTASITERYHWTRIKDTVAQSIRNCSICRDPTKALKRKKDLSPQLGKPTHTIHGSAASGSMSLHQHHHDSHGTSHNTGNHPTQQDYDSMVNEDQGEEMHHRPHDNLLQGDLAHLDIPSNILDAVDAVHRMQQQQQNHTSQTQPSGANQQTLHSQSQSSQSHANQSQQNQQQGTYADQVANRRFEPNHSHSQHHTPQTTSATPHSQPPPPPQPQRLRQFESQNTGYVQQSLTPHQQQEQSNASVDPNVGFNSQQSGSEIEIARALINANGENSQGAEGDEDLF